MFRKLTNTEDGFSAIYVILHWLMLALILATYALMLLKGMYQQGSYGRELMAYLHYMLGMTIFVLVWVRLVAKSLGTTPEVFPPLPYSRWLAAKFVHLSLYALLISMPLLGWLTLSAQGGDISVWGIHLPSLIGKDKNLSMMFKNIHEEVATFGYYLVGLHAAAALFQYYFKRDNTLSLVIPKLRCPPEN
jgi:cytochrome b561